MVNGVVTLHLHACFSICDLRLENLVLLSKSADFLLLLPDLAKHVLSFYSNSFNLYLMLLVACLLGIIGCLLQKSVLLNQLAHLSMHHL